MKTSGKGAGRTDRKGGWRAASFIYVMMFADYLAVVGIGVNLVTYAYGNLHLSLARAATISTSFMGLANITPLFWGFLADAYFGRLLISIVSFAISFAGLLLLTLAVSVHSLQPHTCVPSALNPVCPEASHAVQNWFLAAIYLLAVGSGGLKPTLLAMGQEQFDQDDSTAKGKGNQFFSGYYAVVNVSSALGTTVFIYLQSNVGFDWGYGATFGVYCVAILLYCAGMSFYRQTKPKGSILTRLVQVVVVAVKNMHKTLPKHADDLYEVTDERASIEDVRKVLHTDRFRFLDKAAIQPDGSHRGPVTGWDLCTVTQVEELKALVQILPVWLCSTCVWVMYAQVTSVCVEQASTMDRKLGRHFTIPAASSIAVGLVAGVIFIPIYEKLLVPQIRRVTGHPQGLSPLRRTGVAFVLATVSMVVGAQVEQRRVNVIRDNNVSDLEALLGGVPMSVFWLVPQLAILGAVEILLGVAQIHFFYEETPDSMRSLGLSLFFAAISIGYFISTALINGVNRATKHSNGGWLAGGFNRGGLRNFYYLLATIVGISFVVFVGCAHWYKYKTVQPTHQSKVQPGPAGQLELELELEEQSRETK